MKRHPITLSLVLAWFIILMASCRDDSLPDKLPDLTIARQPANGLTTDIFQIKVEPAIAVKGGTTMFYRWDWNNDGAWDTPFTTTAEFTHRFMQPGNVVARLEYSDGKKQVRSQEMTLIVEQGHSAPRPAFRVTPAKGNIETVFTLDAGITRDDEDSLGQLKFRWDYAGDGSWNTGYVTSPVTTWQYKLAGTYMPKLEARDPSGKAASFTGEVTVTMEDSLIIAAFTMTDTLIRVGDTIHVDASGSYHSKDRQRQLVYSWYLPYRMEWSIPDTTTRLSFTVGQKGAFTIILKAIDQETRLFNMVSREYYAADQNLPPVARIQAGSAFGNILTQFYFDAWPSSDDYQAPGELFVRWDFDGDGAWDTPFSTDKAVFHQYTGPGDYTLCLQAKDQEGLTSNDRKVIHVSPYTNETGYFRDQRDGNYYGTVKIGNQWWMSENLDFQIPPKLKEGVLQWLCLFEQSKWCEQVGKIYRIGAVVENRSDPEFVPVCPTGWRVPSKEDWESLFNSVGGEQNVNELRFGGKADFNALDLGYGDYYFVYLGMVIIDTVYEFHETFRKSWFLSSSNPYDPNHARVDVWQWGTGKDAEPWFGYGSAKLYMPVRCVKE